MTMETNGSDALRALHTSLASEREWKNVQHTVVSAFNRVAAVLEAQARQSDAMMSRLDRLEASCGEDLDAKMEDLHTTIASNTKKYIASSDEQLMGRVCAHIDACLVAHTAKLEETWASRLADKEKSDQLKREETERVLRQHTMRDMDELLKKRPQDDSKLEAVERQLKRLEKHMRVMENDFTTKWTSWQRELTTALQSKASLGDVASSVDLKLSSIQVQFAPKTELDHVISLVEELQESQALASEDIERVQRAMERFGGNAETEQMKSHINELLNIAEKMQQEQTALKSLTANHPKHTDQDTDTKQAVLRLHEAVKSVRRSVETVAKRAETEALSEQVAVIRKQLRSEIYQARYIWKEGRPTAKQTVPWSSQTVNSNADVFVWQRSQPDAVTTMIPGLYHLQAAFFTPFSPTLQVLVNGEPALILTYTEGSAHAKQATNQENSASFTNHTAPSVPEFGTRRRRLHHSAGEIVGVEIAAFLALPARAVVSIGYDVDERAQGFLNLRKL